jgi:TM2 domain-containing membrane protein YozV
MLGLSEAGEDTQKSLRQAYLLWACLGLFGAHRFYLARGTSGATMLVISVLGLILFGTGSGAAFLDVMLLWLGIDALLLPKMHRATNTLNDDANLREAMRKENRAWH